MLALLDRFRPPACLMLCPLSLQGLRTLAYTFTVVRSRTWHVLMHESVAHSVRGLQLIAGPPTGDRTKCEYLLKICNS